MLKHVQKNEDINEEIAICLLRFILFWQKYIIMTFLLFRCLLDVTLRDIIRKNDGDMMMTMWRLHMILQQ